MRVELWILYGALGPQYEVHFTRDYHFVINHPSIATSICLPTSSNSHLPQLNDSNQYIHIQSCNEEGFNARIFLSKTTLLHQRRALLFLFQHHIT